MTAAFPGAAPPRGDLPYLRRRTLRRAPAVAPPPLPVTPQTLPQSAPPRAAASPPARISDGLLDLSAPAAAPEQISATARVPAPAPPRPRHRELRIAAGERLTLTPAAPAVTLTRIQSAAGGLQITLASAASGVPADLYCLYELSSGAANVVYPARRLSPSPPGGDPAMGRDGATGAVIRAGGGENNRLTVDLRHSRQLRRAVVGLLAPPGELAAWDGVLVVGTYGGASVQFPLQAAPSGTLVALSLYNVAGEIVLRAEREPIAGLLRDAARAYGFDSITWVDAVTPLAQG